MAGAEVELLKLQASLVRAQSSVSVNSNTLEDSTPSNESKSGAPEWLLRVKLASKTETLELGVESREDALEWRKAIT